MLGKMLNVGGMDNSSPRASQSPNRFRVARNVYRTPDGRIIPRHEVTEIAGQSANHRYIHYYTQYDSSMLSVVSHDISGNLNVDVFKDNTRLPLHSFCTGGTNLDTNDWDTPYQFMSFRKNNTTYFLNPFDGACFKYDGVEVSAMGCSQPILSCSDYNAAGNQYIRVIQHCVDFDNNEVASELVQFRTNVVGFTNIRVDGGATNIIGNLEVSPEAVITTSSNFDSPYFIESVLTTYNAGTQDFSFNTVETNVTSTRQIGTYILVRHSYTATLDSGLPEIAKGIALRVKSVSPLVLDATNAKYLTLNNEWKTGTVNGSLAGFCLEGSRNIFTVWASNNANGNYVYRGISFSYPYSTTSNVVAFNTASLVSPISSLPNTVVTISPNLGDWYDVVIKKLNPNSVWPKGFSSYFNNGGLTQFQDQIILWSDDLIYFSDTSLAGSFEQLSAANFIRIGDSEFGKIISCCGTQDFMFVSRERKNYFVAGNISTGNYRVQEITEAEIGCWFNGASIAVKDTCIFITTRGVYQVSGGGRCVLLSKYIHKNFSRYDDFDVFEDVSFTLIGTNVYDDLVNDLGLSVAYDEFRELLLFMRKGPQFAANPILVLDTGTGEFYEWDGVVAEDGKYATAIGFKDSKLYIGKYTETTGTLGAKTFIEDKSASLQYPFNYPIKLITTWITAGDPSLEKQILQLKVFGRIYSDGNTSSIKAVHFKDWDYETEITNAEYFPDSDTQFSHKKRLNSDKALAASCGIIVNTPRVTFEIESMEIEFNGIQKGMKR